MNSKVFTIPSRNLFCLSGQQHDSKVVLDRIREGTEPERNEPCQERVGSVRVFGTHFGNSSALVETYRRTMVELVEQIKRNMGQFLRI